MRFVARHYSKGKKMEKIVNYLKENEFIALIFAVVVIFLTRKNINDETIFSKLEKKESKGIF